MFLRKFAMIILFVRSVYTFNLTNVAHDRFKRSESPGKLSLHKYLRYGEIMSYLEDLEENYQDKVEILDIGKSYEGRAIPCIRISSNLKQQTKPMILVDAGIHAREWIAPSTALYLIKQLVEKEKNAKMISKVDWLIIPLVNPDGYEYSHTVDRMWRKTRSKGKKCYGVDLNRNFGFHWMEKDSSDDECSEIYAGPKPFSEPESQNLRDVATAFKNQIKLYITLHSYGPLMLFPWSFREHTVVNNQAQHAYLGKLMRGAISKIGGTDYTVGASTTIFDTISGVSDDWAKGVLGIPLTFTIELPPGGDLKFDPPTTDIVPVGHETFQVFKVVCKYIGRKYGTAVNNFRKRNRRNKNI